MMQEILIITILVLWLTRTIKSLFFWTYLIQIKEYKLRRLIDHFRTYKGRSLILNPLLWAKIILLAVLFFYINNVGWLHAPFAVLISIIYLSEAGGFVWGIYRKNSRFPKPTLKSGILLATACLIIAYITYLAFSIRSVAYVLLILLTADLLVPVIALALAAALYPPTAYIKRRIINMAQTKRWSLNNLLTIGVTGSYGKTSTKEFLAHILSEKFRVAKTQEHQNTEMSVSNFILKKLKSDDEIFVCEMGAYVRGEIKLLARVAKPKVAVITGANEQHLSLFGSMDNLLAGEGGKELIESLPKNGLAVFNGNNKYAEAVYRSTDVPKKITYSYSDPSSLITFEPDVWAKNIKIEMGSLSFDVFSKKSRVGANFKVNLLGAHNIENILLAIAVAEDLGISVEKIQKSVSNLDPKTTGMELIKSAGGINIVKSTYSTNPTAIISHLEYLDKAWAQSKKIIVMPCLIELGSASKDVHKKIGLKIGKICDLGIITTMDSLEAIRAGALGESSKIFYSESPVKITEKIKSVADTNAVILLEGRLPDRIIESIKNV